MVDTEDKWGNLYVCNGTCKKADNKSVYSLERCPLLNFDDDGQNCVPSMCEFFVKTEAFDHGDNLSL